MIITIKLNLCIYKEEIIYNNIYCEKKKLQIASAYLLRDILEQIHLFVSQTTHQWALSTAFVVLVALVYTIHNK